MFIPQQMALRELSLFPARWVTKGPKSQHPTRKANMCQRQRPAPVVRVVFDPFEDSICSTIGQEFGSKLRQRRWVLGLLHLHLIIFVRLFLVTHPNKSQKTSAAPKSSMQRWAKPQRDVVSICDKITQWNSHLAYTYLSFFGFPGSDWRCSMMFDDVWFSTLSTGFVGG